MEVKIKAESISDDDVQFVASWRPAEATTELRRLPDFKKMSISKIKQFLFKNGTTVEAVASTSGDPLAVDPLLQDLMFKCSLCFQLFNMETDLRRHVEDHDKNDVAEPKKRLPRVKKSARPKPAYFECDACKKIFHRRRYFVQHYRRIHGAAVFKCQKCFRVYRTEKSLKTHTNNACIVAETSDINVDELTCRYCKKIFQRKHYVKRHVKNVHESVPLACVTCFKIFSCRRNLNKHESRMHK